MDPSQPSGSDPPISPAAAGRGGFRSLRGPVQDRALAVAVSGLAFGAYWATMSWTAFPGLPVQSLLDALGWSSNPGAIDPLWGGLVKISARLPLLPVAAWTGLFAALFGSFCVYLVVRLMGNVGYRRWMAWTKSSQAKERQARCLSGCVAGLYLAACVPFWVAATRSLPATFHLWLLLLAAHWFSAYQRSGKRVHLGLLGLLYGVGMAEFATFIVFLPLALAFMGMEFYRWRALASRTTHAVFWGGLLAGAAGYPLHAFRLVCSGACASPAEALGRILQAQFDSIILLRTHPGFIVILFFCVVPWLLLFAISRRSPWFYEVPQVLVRLMFIGGLLALFFNASFSPWRMLGMHYLMVTPYLLFAICMGYMAGEFWILGEPPPPRSSRARRMARRAAGAFAVLLPVAIVAGGVWNGREADGRHGAFAAKAVAEILSRIGSRDVLYSAGPLDDSLRLAAGERRLRLRVVRATRTESPTYLRHLAGQFTNDLLRLPLSGGDFARFHRNWMLTDGALARTAAVDLPDAFHAFAHPVPDGLVYRLEPAVDGVDGNALLESQTALWHWLEDMAAHPVPERSLARPQQDWLCAVGAKTANNLGVWLAEQGDRDGARKAFRAARRMHPENLAALMNLLELARGDASPDPEGLEEEWNRRREGLRAERWTLGGRYGYLWNPSAWAERGFPWALSGRPSEIGTMPPGQENAAAELDLHAQWLDQAYLRWGAPVQEEWALRAMLGRNDKDTDALMELARLALRRQDPDTAEVYMAEALAMGLPEAELRFDRAIATAVRGDRAQAVVLLKELERENPSDVRAWSALLRLAEASDPVRQQAMRILKIQPSGHVGIHLVLAWEHLLNYRWKDAEEELDRVVQSNPRHRQAWELLVVLGQLKGNRRLIESGTSTLIAEDPQHPLTYIRRALGASRQGRLDAAESELKVGLQLGRNPDLLNTLAYIKIQNNEDEKDIRALLDEAIAKRPFHPVYRCTRIELELREGNLDEAWAELQTVRNAMPEFMPAALLAARILVAQGNLLGVRRMAETMHGWRKSARTPERRKMLEEIIGQMETRP